MLAYAAGNAAAFDTLYARHKGGVYRYMLRHCGNAGIADELFQDVWMNAIRARASYAPTAKFTTWLYTLAHHRLVDHWRASGQVELRVDRRRGRRRARAASKRSRLARRRARGARRSPTRSGVASHAALAALPAVQREAFLLQQEAGMSLAEIAELTGAGEETVKSRLRYATAKLRARWRPCDEHRTVDRSASATPRSTRRGARTRASCRRRALDAAILAAARARASARSRATTPRSRARAAVARWWMPLAAAATIGAIAFGVHPDTCRRTSQPSRRSSATR